MGTVTIQVIGDASVGTKSKSYALSDADVNRLVNWAKSAYATAPTVQVPSPPPLTVAQALVAWADGVIAGTKNNVVNWERTAAQAAVANPAPIVTS